MPHTLESQGYRRCEEAIGKRFAHVDCGGEVECWAKIDEHGTVMVWHCPKCNETWDAAVPTGK